MQKGHNRLTGPIPKKNILNQDFTAERPNQIRVSDIICYELNGKRYYIAVIGGQTVQKVEIHYKMIGYVELPHMSRTAEQSYLAAFGRKEIGRGA